MFQPNPAVNPMAFTLFNILPLIIMGILIFNMLQRALWKGWGKKRAATFYLAMVFGAIFVSVILIGRFRLPDLLLIPVALGAVVFIIAKRKSIFPFRIRCSECHAVLSLRRVISGKNNLCHECADLDAEKKEKTK
jgi:hypothetical protein